MLGPVNTQNGVVIMTNPTMEPLSERLNVQVTPTMKADVSRLMEKQSRRTEADVVRAALTAYLRKELNR
jgi:hypothetical protein